MERKSKRWCGGALAGVLLGAVGCASPGPPRAPSLRLPEPVKSLSAERQGGSVVVRFKTPVETTDKKAIAGTVRAGLCRSVAGGPCKATSSFPGLTVVQGDVRWVDALPAELAHGPVRKMGYRVQLFNDAGRTAGWSEPVFAAAGGSPAMVEGLKAEGSRAGIVLQWKKDPQPGDEVLLERRGPAGG